MSIYDEAIEMANQLNPDGRYTGIKKTRRRFFAIPIHLSMYYTLYVVITGSIVVQIGRDWYKII
jgi:hypothetical protein